MEFRNTFIAGSSVSIALYVVGVILSFAKTQYFKRFVLFNEGFEMVAVVFVFGGEIASLFEEYRERKVHS